MRPTLNYLPSPTSQVATVDKDSKAVIGDARTLLFAYKNACMVRTGSQDSLYTPCGVPHGGIHKALEDVGVGRMRHKLGHLALLDSHERIDYVHCTDNQPSPAINKKEHQTATKASHLPHAQSRPVPAVSVILCIINYAPKIEILGRSAPTHTLCTCHTRMHPRSGHSHRAYIVFIRIPNETQLPPNQTCPVPLAHAGNYRLCRQLPPEP